MSFLLDRLYPASFNGADFFFQNIETTGGKKTVAHEYPNKDFRWVEELGLNQRTFTIDAIITGFFYEDNKKNLENALNKPGIGIFVHPTLGIIPCICTGWTLSEADKDLGIARYSITLLETKDSQYPEVDPNNISKIADLYRELYDFIRDELNGEYLARFARNILYGAQKLKDILDTLNLITKTLESFGKGDASSAYKRQALLFNRNVYKIAGQDGNIGGNTTTLVSLFDGLANNAQDRYDASNSLFGFGKDDTFLAIPSESLIERNINLKLLNGSINTLAFTNLIDSAKDIDYENEDHLNIVANEIDVKYDELVNSSANYLSNGVRDKIDEIKTQSRIFFDQKRLVVNKVITVETKEMPITVLVYQYYGNVDDYEQIITLNQSFNPSRISGEVKILENE